MKANHEILFEDLKALMPDQILAEPNTQQTDQILHESGGKEIYDDAAQIEEIGKNILIKINAANDLLKKYDPESEGFNNLLNSYSQMVSMLNQAEEDTSINLNFLLLLEPVADAGRTGSEYDEFSSDWEYGAEALEQYLQEFDASMELVAA